MLKQCEDDFSYQLQLNFGGNSYKLKQDMTLKEIESELKSKKDVSHKVEFYAPDGSRFASCTKLYQMMQLPYFKLDFDDKIQYHVHSLKAFGEPVSFLTPSEKQIYDTCVGTFQMKDMKSRTACKIVNNVLAEIEDRERGQKWS